MAKTLLEYKAELTDAMGGPPAVILTSVDVTKTLLINEAGRAMCSAWLWNWLRPAPALISLTASQSYVNLPSDFSRMESVWSADIGQFLCLTTPDFLNQLRAAEIAWDGVFYAAVHRATQANTTSLQTAPRLELYPPPASSVTDALRVVYRRTWTTLANTNSLVPNIPEFMEPMLSATVRAYGRDIAEDGNGAILAGVIGKVRGQPVHPLFVAATEEDGGAESNVGPIRHGAAAMVYQGTDPFQYGSLAAPA